MNIRRSRSLIVSGIALFVSGCVSELTAPNTIHTPPTPRRSVDGPLGTHTITIPPLNGIDASAVVTDEETGITIPDNSTVVVTVSGTVNLSLNDGYTSGEHSSASQQIEYVGRSVPPDGLTLTNGAHSNRLAVSYRISGQSNTYASTADSAGATSATTTLHVDHGGELLVSRLGVMGEQTCVTDGYYFVNFNEMYCFAQGTPTQSYLVSSYVMTGNQTISVKRLADDVTLDANPADGKVGRSVTFTATSLEPDSYLASWSWAPDSGSARTVACTTSANPCVTDVQESGTMTVAYYFRPLAQYRRARIHVTAIQCAKRDTMLDDPVIRAALLSALGASNPDSAAGSGFRHEEGYNIWTRPDGSHFVTRFADPAPTECGVLPDPSPTPPEPGALWSGLLHTHPAQTDDPVYGCPPARGVKFSQHPGDGFEVPHARPHSNGGGSPPDWKLANNGGGPVYIINKDLEVYKLVPDNQPSPPSSNPYKWKATSDHACWDGLP